MDSKSPDLIYISHYHHLPFLQPFSFQSFTPNKIPASRERQAARAKRNAAAHHDRHEEIGLPVNKLEKGPAFLLISLFHEPFRSAATAVSIL